MVLSKYWFYGLSTVENENSDKIYGCRDFPLKLWRNLSFDKDKGVRMKYQSFSQFSIVLLAFYCSLLFTKIEKWNSNIMHASMQYAIFSKYV